MMDKQEISYRRLKNQQITHQQFHRPEDILSWMIAIQGQDYTGAKWSVGLRTNCTNNDVEQAFSQKKIVRLWLMRGTLHIAAAKDVKWSLSLFSDRIIKSNSRRYKELELDNETFMKTNRILENALISNEELSRSALCGIINNHGISTKGQRAAYILQRASYDGIICQSSVIKNKPYFILQSRLEPSGMLNREESLRKLAGGYFTSRGPATLQDFVWWSGLTVAECRAAIDSLKSTLIHETIQDKTYWFVPDNQNDKSDSLQVRLLPGFDEYLLGYKDRSASLDSAHANFWCPGGNGMFNPVVIVNGKVAGTWKRNPKNNSVETYLFDTVSDDIRNKIKIAEEKLLKYLDITVVRVI